MTVSRPDKLNHLQTILYEVDMLRYCAKKLATRSWKTNADSWVLLESFLLHYRNLVDFFGKRPEDDDLTILKPEAWWRDRAAPAKETLEELKKLADQKLRDEYECRKKPDRISKYLQHCTEQRIEVKVWSVGTMFYALDALTKKFEKLLPENDKIRPWGDIVQGAVVFTGDASTTATTMTSSTFGKPKIGG